MNPGDVEGLALGTEMRYEGQAEENRAQRQPYFDR